MSPKKSFILILFSFSSAFAQIREFQEGNTTQLVQFEKLLPSKTYNYKNSDIIVKWHLLVFDLIEQTPSYTPNVAARTMAYLNLGAYEAIRPAYPNLNSLEGQLQEYYFPKELSIDSSNFSASVALNTCMFKLIDAFFVAAPYVWMERAQALKDSINTKILKNSIEDIKSINYGLSVADYILKYAQTDGAAPSIFRSYDLAYKLPKCESCFEINRVADLENTGPLHPYWHKNRTFLKENQSDSLWVKPSQAFSKYPNSAFYKEANEVYQTSKTVTAGSEKHSIANFWDDAATYSYTAVGHSAAILTQVIRNKPLGLDSASAYYLTLTLGLNDAMINTWRLKYHFNLIRPGAYIKKYIDSAWEPVILTPPFPEFPSGHSAQSAAMATILSNLLGSETSFKDYSKFWVGPARSYANFWAAANETSISRLYGGIHFRDALTKGQELGKIIGKNTLKLKTFKQ